MGPSLKISGKMSGRTQSNKKLGGTGVDLKIAVGQTTKLAISSEFDQFLQKNKNLIRPIYKLIRGNRARLAAGKPIIDKKRGIDIRRAATGGYKGRCLTLKVNVGEIDFFVKESSFSLVDYARIMAIVDNCLKIKNYKIGRFNIHIIKPHLLYERRAHSYLVTDFYNKNEVKQVSDMREKDRCEILAAIDVPNRELWKYGVEGVIDFNAFYQQKTNTILLFDIRH